MSVSEHNLARLDERHLERVGPDHPTLLFEGTWHTTGELADRAARVAAGLAAEGSPPATG